ncbi:MAG: VOC family protein [Solirubrobacteraceae bacterium]|nr:VOC family protein [Solirubrobacteraceae bacterium]
MTAPTFYPALRYRDPDAAIAWLEEALGFTPQDVFRDDASGTVAHAELVFGDGMIMLGGFPEPSAEHLEYDQGITSTYAYVADPDALHARAVAAGADLAMALRDTPYGSREFSVRDPEGHVWSFGTYRPAANGSG